MNSIAKVILVNIVLLAAILCALEFGSRIIHPVELPDPLITETKLHWTGSREPDPILFWKMRPNMMQAKGVKLTNSLGLRGEEISSDPTDEFRVLSLGESTTFSGFLRNENTYSGLLERGLGVVDGKPVRVINAGVPGYTLYQGVSYLEVHGLSLQPQVVMTYFGYNDFLPTAYRVNRDAGAETSGIGLADLELYEKRNTWSYKLFHVFQQYSNLARTMFERSLPSKAELKTGVKPRVPESDRRELLAKLRNICQQNQIQLVVIIPWYREFAKHAPLLRELKEWDDVRVIDLPKELADLEDQRLHFFMDFIHPNAAGHRKIAEVLVKEFRALLGGRVESGT